jgi:hypothetical protein
MLGTKSLKTLAAASALALLAGAAGAATVKTYCPGTSGAGDREFTVTIEGPDAAGCVLWGSGNTDIPANEAAILAEVSPAILLDKSDGASLVPGVEILVTGVKSLSGLWEILVPTGFTLTNAFIALKSGEGQLDPDFALFSIPDGILSGSWSIDAGNQSLSHISLYGTLVPATVPVPAAGLLLIGALGGLAALRRRRTLA